jgi:hypothetical protein
MEELVEKELQSLSPQFSHWDAVMRRYDKHLYNSGDEDVKDEDVAMMNEVIGIYATILKACTRCGHFRDTWKLPIRFSLIPFGHETIIESGKMGGRFALGRYQQKIFLSWAYFIELRSTGNFSFQQNASPRAEQARDAMKRLRNEKSNIFRAIRNYILLECYSGNVDDLGSLEVSWPVNTAWSELISQAVRAFRCLYKLDYLLYKHAGRAPHMADYGGPGMLAAGFGGKTGITQGIDGEKNEFQGQVGTLG